MEGHHLHCPGEHRRVERALQLLRRPGEPYIYHCHMLWHEDQGMMAQYVFTGVEPSTAASSKVRMHH